jgi:hypothetical protein
MKTLNILKRSGLALIAFCFMLTIANAQARYKHMPRVKIEKQPRTVVVGQEKTMGTTTAAIVNTEANTSVATESTTPVIENTTVASNNEDVVVLETKTKSVVKHKKAIKSKRTADKNVFTKRVKENSKLMDVKDVKKAALQRWLMLMIIFLAIGVLCIILALVFSFTYLLSLYVLATILYIVGALLITAGLVFLVLGLTGVMS